MELVRDTGQGGGRGGWWKGRVVEGERGGRGRSESLVRAGGSRIRVNGRGRAGRGRAGVF